MGGTGSPRESVSLLRKRWLALAPIVLIIPAVLFLAYRWNPRFSHNLAETFSIIVAVLRGGWGVTEKGYGPGIRNPAGVHGRDDWI